MGTAPGLAVFDPQNLFKLEIVHKWERTQLDSQLPGQVSKGKVEAVLYFRLHWLTLDMYICEIRGQSLSWCKSAKLPFKTMEPSWGSGPRPVKPRPADFNSRTFHSRTPLEKLEEG